MKYFLISAACICATLVTNNINICITGIIAVLCVSASEVVKNLIGKAEA